MPPVAPAAPRGWIGAETALRRLPFLAAAASLLFLAGNGGAGEIDRTRLHPASAGVSDRGTAGPAAPKQILFGDLHVHTTFSIDAFAYSLPLFGGEGAHPPADACDFARYCAAVDFFALTDHAEGLTPEQWSEIKDSVRRCNALGGSPENPEVVAFTGWEWTQVGETPETHYGHKNVVFPGIGDEELPARPITSLSDDVMQQAPPPGVTRALRGIGSLGLSRYTDFLGWIGRLAQMPTCERGVDTRELPPDCRENAPSPAELFEKLSQWGFEVLVIPHGLAWGLHAPLGARIDNQLTRREHDPSRQSLIEIFSGHGNGEEYRSWRGYGLDAAGALECPEPTAEYLPCCWRAGEIMRARCGDLPSEECEARVAQAMRLALEANVDPHLVFPDTRPEDWLDCDQCRDCFKPVFSPRPQESAQYSLAISNFGELGGDGRPLRFRWGFLASSDNHQSRPGTGYKQYARRRMTDARGFRTKWHDRIMRPWVMGSGGDPRVPRANERPARSFRSLFDVERVASFMYPGGLVAVHAEGRDRGAVWQALQRREVYGTSGPRILLWFDLLNGPRGTVPMGSAVEMSEGPRFQVRAVGSSVQQPGCPREPTEGLSPERLEALCRGECHHPGDQRHPIVAVEVVRVRPQASPAEPVDDLIEDPWRRFECRPDPAGCTVTFDDPEFAASGRDAVYYVRALQEETPAINAANLRTAFDAAGRPVRVLPCHGNYRTPFDDDCLSPVRERAWSSPIYVDQAVRTAAHPSSGVSERVIELASRWEHDRAAVR